MKMTSENTGTLGRVLYKMSAGCLALSLLFCLLNGGSADGNRTVLIFFRPEIMRAVFLTAMGCTALLWVLWAAGGVMKAEYVGEVGKTMGACLLLYPLALVLFIAIGFLRLTCNWEVEQHIKGSDNRTYYVLHAPPPMNGAGHSALARRIFSTPVCYMMQIISDDYESAHNSEVVTAGLEDPNPETQRICRMLLATLEKRKASEKHKP